MTRLAVAVALSLLPACTIVVAQQSNADADGSTSDDSTTELPAADTSTGEPVEPEDLSTSTGEERDTSTSTSTGAELVDTSTGEASTSSSTGDDLSTDDSTTTGDLSTETTGADASTSGEPLKALAEPCVLDEECSSGACIGGGFSDVPRCSIPCSVDAAADCLDNGYPGLCTWGGGDAHWCTGAFEPLGLSLHTATPDPDVDYIYYQSSDLLKSPVYQSVYLVPALQDAFDVELGSVNSPGYGPVVVDVYGADGALIGTYEQGDNPTIEPMGVNAYHWLVVRPASDQKALFNLWLKAVPTCNDNVKNGLESDLDCGGDTCDPCADGKQCTQGTDCTSGQCKGGKCAALTLAIGPCAAASVTSAQAYATVVQPKCGCHVGGSGGLTINSAGTLKANTINVDATSALMKRVTPGNIDQSYLLYKAHGQHLNVPGGSGGTMPLGGSPLTDTERCTLVNWVKSGAM